jgi:hypothetical protein
MDNTSSIFKELNPRREGFDVILATPEIRRRGFNFNSKMLQSKKLCFIIAWEGLGEIPRPSALGKRPMHFPFEIIIWDTN